MDLKKTDIKFLEKRARVLNQLQNVICGAGPAGLPSQILGITWEAKLCPESIVRSKDFFQGHTVLLWQIFGLGTQQEVSNHVVAKPELVEQKVAMAFATRPALTSEESHRLIWIKQSCHFGVMHVEKHPRYFLLARGLVADSVQLAHRVPDAGSGAFLKQNDFQNLRVSECSIHDHCGVMQESCEGIQPGSFTNPTEFKSYRSSTW